ncbi:MAG TPA: T9SS type A sorting domain-containing protein [Bacteroidia bacterium]|nr:T9SS type A sorting domain-containing protein [Bacteroidia bacterium]
MKKIYTLAFLALGSAAAVNAQQLVTPTQNQVRDITHAQFDRSKAPNQRTAPVVTTQSFSGWVSYADAKDNDLGGGVSVLGGTYLFPDSTVQADFGAGTYDHPWVHSIGDVFDVAAPSFSNLYAGYSLGRTDAYSIDSIAIVYTYGRMSPSPNADTLICHVYYNSNGTNLTNNGFIGTTAANYGTDTVSFKQQHYTYQTNTPTASGSVQVYKIPLTIADTTLAFYGTKAFYTGYGVPAGKIAAITFEFVPGYSYNFGDTITLNKNYFTFASTEEAGTNTYPIYYDCNYQGTDCDFNCSSVIRTQERYNIDPAQSWNGLYIPKYAFTQAYGLENHYIYYYITSPPAGIAGPEQAAGFSLGQNVPNPATGNTSISYTLANEGNVALTIYDITGKQVMLFNEGAQNAGTYKVDVNTNSLQAGVYFYELNVDGKKAVRKMVISE